MTMTKLKEGLEILLKYGDGNIAAEHDEIFAGSDGKSIIDVSEEDRQSLDKSGWMWDERYDCWRHFT